MGCTQSSEAGGTFKEISKTERVMNGRRGVDKSERIHTPSERARISLRKKLSSVTTTGGETTTATASARIDPKLDAEGKLVAEEVARRISGDVETRDAILGDLKSGEGDGLIRARYAALTQRGYYPDDPHKANQDRYRIVPAKFASGDGDAFFGVFDGHGDNGHDCAEYASNRLHVLLAKNIKRQRAAANAARLKEMEREGVAKPKDAFHPGSWPYLDEEGYEKACRMAHLQCNRAMHDDKEVKDSMSGTTAISVGFHAGRMTVSNVGDSRAVLGHRLRKEDMIDSSGTPFEEEKKEIGEESDCDSPEHIANIGTIDGAAGSGNDEFDTQTRAGKLVAIPLSEDQTPYRRDERERLRKAGARICSIDQMEGIAPMHDNWGEVDLGVDIDTEGDPPRVWCMDHDYPGTAFSRSLGDSVGGDIGVNAEPEILTKDVTRGDEVLVIASDGIFEFLTNQRVIDICGECQDPLHACTRLLEESYGRWLHYELRTDDITCIVVFLKNGRADNKEAVHRLMNKKHTIKDAARVKMQRGHSMPNTDD